MIGDAEFELTDFLSDNVIKREYFKYISEKAIKKVLSWGINVNPFFFYYYKITLGIKRSTQDSDSESNHSNNKYY